MSNKLIHDRSGNISSKRVLILLSGILLILLSGFAGFGHLYFLFFKNLNKDLTSILALLGVLSGFIVMIAGLTLGEKKDTK